MNIVKRLALALVVLFAFGTSARAQAASTLIWDYAKPLATVQTYTQAIQVDAAVLTIAPTCVATSATVTTCSIPITTLAAGTHSISITATLGNESAQTIVAGLNPANAPANATNFRYQINVTVNIP